MRRVPSCVGEGPRDSLEGNSRRQFAEDQLSVPG